MEKYIQITFFPDKCLLSSFLQVSLKRVLYKVIILVTVVKILYYDQHAFSFRVQPVRNMTLTTIELLSKLFRHVILPTCF